MPEDSLPDSSAIPPGQKNDSQLPGGGLHHEESAHSLSEIDALVLKAYRGAGFSWGMAQEAGRAAASLAVSGAPAACYFSELLQQTDGVDAKTLKPEINNGHWFVKDRSLCPVMSGCALIDFGLPYFTSESSLELGVVLAPGILVPFLSSCAQTIGSALVMSVDSNSFHIDGESLLDWQRLIVPVGRVSVRQASQPWKREGTALKRAYMSKADNEYLNLLAHRTYVPASEQSRNSGAGAGLTDND